MKLTNTGKRLEELVDELFRPTARQREIKNSFWYSWKQGPTKSKPTLAAAIEITGCPTIEKWSSEDTRFKGWFLNDQDHGQRLEVLFDKSIDVLEDIMYAADKSSDRLKAIEIIAKLAQKINKPETEVKFLDSDIQNMSLVELEEMIKKSLPATKDSPEEEP